MILDLDALERKLILARDEHDEQTRARYLESAIKLVREARGTSSSRRTRHDPDETVSITGVVVHPSSGAVLLDIDDKQHWIPYSQITDGPEDYGAGETVTLEITAWIAIEKGLA